MLFMFRELLCVMSTQTQCFTLKVKKIPDIVITYCNNQKS